MKVSRIAAILFILGAASGVSLFGQTRETPPAAPASPAAPAPPPADPAVSAPQDIERGQDVDTYRYARPVVRLANPFVLRQGGEVSEAVVIMADATIEGRVSREVVVVLGNLHLGRTAVVEGSVVVVGGVVTIEPGASIGDEFVVVGGAVDAPADFIPGGEHVVIGPPGMGHQVRQIVPWFTRGLLWGRVIVPGLPWVWAIVGISLLVNLALALAFPRAVRACADTLSSRPLGSFFVGMLALLLVGPVSTILAISVVGVIVIPFAICAVIVGWLLGKVSVARWIGAGIVHQDEPDSRGETMRSLLIGFAAICVAYMIPVLGLAAWALVGVLGLGTATLTLIAGLKRERPEPPPRPVEPLPEPPAPTPSMTPAADLALASEAPPGAAPDGPAAAAAVSSPRPADLTAFPRATFLDRLAACVLDLVLVAIAYNLLSWNYDEGMFFVLLMGYHMAFWTWKGTTVGGIICNLRFVRTDGSPLRPADALVRGLASLFSAAALGLGFLWILRDPDRQAWHDKIAGTYVVSVPRNWPLP